MLSRLFYIPAIVVGAVSFCAAGAAAQSPGAVDAGVVREVVRSVLLRVEWCTVFDSLSRALKKPRATRWAVVREVATMRTPIWAMPSDSSSLVVLRQRHGLTAPPCSWLGAPRLIGVSEVQTAIDDGYSVVSLSVVRPAGEASHLRSAIVELYGVTSTVYVAQLRVRKERTRWHVRSILENYHI